MPWRHGHPIMRIHRVHKRQSATLLRFPAPNINVPQTTTGSHSHGSSKANDETLPAEHPPMLALYLVFGGDDYIVAFICCCCCCSSLFIASYLTRLTEGAERQERRRLWSSWRAAALPSPLFFFGCYLGLPQISMASASRLAAAGNYRPAHYGPGGLPPLFGDGLAMRKKHAQGSCGEVFLYLPPCRRQISAPGPAEIPNGNLVSRPEDAKQRERVRSPTARGPSGKCSLCGISAF